jgi:hypothetical protein
MHTITLDISSANISRDLASMLICSLGMADYGETHHLSPTLPLVRCIGAALGMGLVSLNASYSLTIAPGAQKRPAGPANL